MRLWLSIRVFFATLFSRSIAEEVREILAGDEVPEDAADDTAECGKAKKPSRRSAKPARSEALTLLAALQREARFVDFIKEPIADYSDAEIGAAVRDVHRQCGEVLARMFDLAPLRDEEEEAEIEVPQGFQAAAFHLTGKVAGEPPYRGQLAHHGWVAGKCDMPTWSGSAETAMIVAPAEVEVAE